MHKTVRLKTGETIIILEEISAWDGSQTYYKVQRENGSLSIIELNKFNKLIKQENNTQDRSTAEKLQLFYSYFQGRPDVYATKWKSKSGNTGFSPHGEGTWTNKNGKYRKEIHTYYPYTIQTVNDHIRAEKDDFKMGAGIYPILENDCTKLVVIDFDNENAVEEAHAVVKACCTNNIDVLIERSQSGKGIHLWFFFSEEILASKARYFVQSLIRHAMMEQDVVNFKSFDRIIPMQDMLTANGFGNIIALPLRADKVKENKTVFLDEDFEVAADMWTTLASIKKYNDEEITTFNRYFKDTLPVEYYKRESQVPNLQLIQQLKIIESGELMIKKNTLSRKNLIQLAHLATFHNPEFYRKQNMRAPTWNIEQFITSASEDKDYLYLPRGLKPKLEKVTSKIDIIDKLNNGHPIEVSFRGNLRDNQKKVVSIILKHQTGIISAPTGFGKTVIAANLIARKKVSTLIIVHSKSLAEQWKDRLTEFLDIQSEPFPEYTPTGRLRKKGKIGELHSGKERLGHNIDVALYQSIASKENLTNFLEPYGMVIIDEAHHVAAQTFEDVLKKINARYLYGLTATPDRKDGLTPILFMRLGEMIVEEKQEQYDDLLIPKYFYPRFTNYSDMNPELSYQQHLNNMADNEDRNEQIVVDVIENIQERRTCLILTERVSHTDHLKELLEDRVDNVPVYVLTSEKTDRKNKDNIGKMQSSKEAFIVIATSLKVGEGFDLLKLESIFFALPFSWKDRTTQYVGRLNRGLAEKEELRVYDYVDIGVEMFGRMYQKRMRVYYKLHYQLAEDDKTRENQTQLFTVQTYREALRHDLTQSKKVVIGIVSIRQLVIPRLNEIDALGIKIEIVIKGEKLKQHTELVKQLEEINVVITRINTDPFSFIICDEKIVWYGNITFGAHSAKDDTVLRLLNVDISKKMIEQYL